MSLEHWTDSNACILDEHGVTVTSEQIDAIAKDVQGASEVSGEICGTPENPLARELADTQAKLKRERDKTICRECNGHGIISSPMMGGKWANSTCHKCGGHGHLYSSR